MLRDGELVAFPTETVYGLGADATNEDAVTAVYTIKGRPRSNPLIIHVSNIDDALEIAHFDKRADILAETFWARPPDAYPAAASEVRRFESCLRGPRDCRVEDTGQRHRS